jgi:hypothetical protein
MNGYIVLIIFILATSLINVVFDELAGVKVSGKWFAIIIHHSLWVLVGMGIAVILYRFFLK